jgi:hypothetical protein
MTLTVKRRLELYGDILKIVHKDKVSKYPFNIMSRDEVMHTLNEISLKYQGVSGTYNTRDPPKRGGGDGRIHIFTM